VRIGGSAAVKILLRLVWESPPFSQTARKDGAPAGGVKFNVKISLGLDLGMPTLPRRTREGWGNRRRQGDLRLKRARQPQRSTPRLKPCPTTSQRHDLGRALPSCDIPRFIADTAPLLGGADEGVRPYTHATLAVQAGGFLLALDPSGKPLRHPKEKSSSFRSAPHAHNPRC
jgi:hypothetical protein